MKLYLTFFILFISSYAITQTTVIPLYQVAAPGSEDWNWSEAEQFSKAWQTQVVYNVVKPTLTLFKPEAGRANGTSVVICPGGGFHALSINSEGFDVAKYLVDKGVTCFVLKYRLIHCLTDDPATEFMNKMGKKEFEDQSRQLIPLAIEDGRNAIAYVRKNVLTYNLSPDRIGIIGFSAGGTVSSAASFDYTAMNKPNFVAPIYPFFPEEMQKTVPADAPPMFIAVASNDQLNLVPHSLALYKSWLNAKKPVELHVYAGGGHGFGMRTQNIPTDKWIDRFSEWLGVSGFLPAPSANVPAPIVKVNPDLDLYQKKEYAYAADKILPYRILYPESYDKSAKDKKYPLVLFLHGGGERGNDNEKQLSHGAALFAEKSNRMNFPAIVVAPQCPADKYWATSTIDRTTSPLKIEFDYTKEPNWNLIAANELIKKLAKEERVDPSRIYVTGLSMGGMGTYESVYRYPDLYAAALPICGGGDLKVYDKRVAKTPFWIFHGDSDVVVDVNLSRKMNEKLKSLGATVKYTEYPGVNHNSWDNVFADPEYLKWMMTQKRKVVK
jgi:predicted peptidase